MAGRKLCKPNRYHVGGAGGRTFGGYGTSTKGPAPYVEKEKYDLQGFGDRAAKAGNAYNLYSNREIGNQGQYSQDYRSFIDTLQKRVAGQGPSVAEEQLRYGTNRNIQQGTAALQTQYGTNAGLMRRLISQEQGRAGQEMAGQGAILRAQEQTQALGQLGGAIQSGRQMELAQQSLNDEMVRFYETLGLSNAQAQVAAYHEQQSLISENVRDYNRLMFEADESRKRREIESKKLAASIVTSIGAAASDERLKTNIEPTSDTDDLKNMFDKLASQYEEEKKGGGIDMAAAASMASSYSDEDLKKKKKKMSGEDFLNTLKAYKYEYKDPEKFGKGENYGVMAQDLEKTGPGKSLVIDTPEGKMVDYGRGFGMLLASQVEINERLKKLEGKR